MLDIPDSGSESSRGSSGGQPRPLLTIRDDFSGKTLRGGGGKRMGEGGGRGGGRGERCFEGGCRQMLFSRLAYSAHTNSLETPTDNVMFYI